MMIMITTTSMTCGKCNGEWHDGDNDIADNGQAGVNACDEYADIDATCNTDFGCIENTGGAKWDALICDDINVCRVINMVSVPIGHHAYDSCCGGVCDGDGGMPMAMAGGNEAGCVWY